MKAEQIKTGIESNRCLPRNPVKERIIKYLQDFGSITPLEAMKDLGVMRLGARIWELIREGYPIVKETECSKNRYGQNTRYARYRFTA